jgi:hypothetical protein
MARVGYCRTSTDRQELGRQQRTLKASGCDRIHEETASGKTLDRPVLNEVLAKPRRGRRSRGSRARPSWSEHGANAPSGRKPHGPWHRSGDARREALHRKHGLLHREAGCGDPWLCRRNGTEGDHQTNRGRPHHCDGGRREIRAEEELLHKGEENHVRELRATGLGYGAIATKTGLSISTVRRILA